MRGAADRHPEAERVELWFMDEARVGQKGRVTHLWYQKGVRPRGVRQQGFSAAHLFGAVCPERGEGVALVLPEVSTAAMDLFLAELSRAIPAGSHAALVLDGAGWHVSPGLDVPPNLTLIHPPPYSPELVWGFACQALTIAASPSRLLSGVQPAGDRSRRSEGSPL
jgi:DDE superfamily endonuclease